MVKGECIVIAAPMHREPSESSENVSELRMGETFEILKSEGHWWLIRCNHDDYTGWINSRQCKQEDDDRKIVLAPSMQAILDKQNGGYECASPLELAEKYYLGTPYKWGGRSLLGVDCSGLVQVCFAHFGIALPRDARDQVKVGSTVESINEIQPNDLCFFGTSPTHISHVGIAMGNDKILHASGYVHIAPLDQQGIHNTFTGEYTHTLQYIRRVWREEKQ